MSEEIQKQQLRLMRVGIVHHGQSQRESQTSQKSIHFDLDTIAGQICVVEDVVADADENEFEYVIKTWWYVVAKNTTVPSGLLVTDCGAIVKLN